MRLHHSLTPVAAALAGAVALWAPTTQAEPVSATGKGVTGGALLGAEAVLITEAALQVKPRWAYLVGGAVGAAGGGVAGYFVEKGGDATASMLLLTAATALAIPTAIVTLNATRYQPSEEVPRDTAALPPARLVAANSPDQHSIEATDLPNPKSARVRIPLFNLTF